MKIKSWLLVRFGAGILLISWLSYSIDFKKVWQPITPRGWLYLVLLFVVINIDRVLMSYKWRILLTAKNIVISFGDIVKSYYVGTFWGIFLPSTVGGDVVRAYRVAKHTGSTKDIASSVMMERILGALTSLLLSIICLLVAVVFVGVFDWQLVIGVSLVFVVAVVIVAFSFHGRLQDRLARTSMLERQGVWGKLGRVYNSYMDYGRHHGALARFVAWSAVEQCVPVIGVYLTALALGKDISFLYAVIFVPLVMTLAKIPLSLDGYGIREGLYVYLFSLVGISHGDAFVIGLLSHVVANLALLPGFIYSSFSISSSKSLF